MISITNLQGEKQKDIQLNSRIFGVKINKHIVFEIVRWQLANRRQGTHSTLTRSQVRGTTKKCKPQKEQGTRHGDKRAPIFRKGGIVFGPKPRDYSYSLNKKLRKLGLSIVLSDKFNHGALKVVDSLSLSDHKTSTAKDMLKALNLTNALFISDKFNDNFSKAINNIPHINKLPVAGLNVYDMLKYKTLVITQEGIDAIVQRLS